MASIVNLAIDWAVGYWYGTSFKKEANTVAKKIFDNKKDITMVSINDGVQEIVKNLHWNGTKYVASAEKAITNELHAHIRYWNKLGIYDKITDTEAVKILYPNTTSQTTTPQNKSPKQKETVSWVSDWFCGDPEATIDPRHYSHLSRC